MTSVTDALQFSRSVKFAELDKLPADFARELSEPGGIFIPMVGSAFAPIHKLTNCVEPRIA